jgi:hypothetical protein
MRNGKNDEVCPSIPLILLHPIACCIALAGLNLQLAAALTIHYSASHLPDSKRR